MKREVVLSVLILMIASAFFINGCSKEKTTMELNSSVCGLEIGQLNLSDYGVKGSEWLSGDKLRVTALIRTNCAETVKNGNFNIEENKIILYYQIEKCNVCATCMCPKYLTYTFDNLEKKDYVFELKEI